MWSLCLCIMHYAICTPLPCVPWWDLCKCDAILDLCMITLCIMRKSTITISRAHPDHVRQHAHSWVQVAHRGRSTVLQGCWHEQDHSSKCKCQEKIEPLYNKVCRVFFLFFFVLWPDWTPLCSSRNQTSGACQRSNTVCGRARHSVKVGRMWWLLCWTYISYPTPQAAHGYITITHQKLRM
jgi:hypothetical protein